MATVKDQWAFLQDVARLISWCAANNYTITGGELWRTIEQQKAYVAAGLSKTMRSRHLERMAFDINLIIEGRLATTVDEYRPIGEYWKSLSPLNRWGGSDFGSFLDANHIERDC